MVLLVQWGMLDSGKLILKRYVDVLEGYYNLMKLILLKKTIPSAPMYYYTPKKN